MLEDVLYRHTQGRHYRGVIADAHAIVKEALVQYPGPATVAVSGGKDSVAMAHIVVQHCDPVVMWNNSGLEMEETEGVVRRTAELLGRPLVIAPGDVMAHWKKEGHDAARRNTRRTHECVLVEPIRKALIENGIVLNFVGLRMDEAPQRKILIQSRGPIRDSPYWGCAVANPMRRWLGADSFAYLDEHGLPIHPAYQRTEWRDRNAIRVGWAWNVTREESGSAEYVRRHYPALYRKLRHLGMV